MNVGIRFWVGALQEGNADITDFNYKSNGYISTIQNTSAFAYSGNRVNRNEDYYVQPYETIFLKISSITHVLYKRQIFICNSMFIQKEFNFLGGKSDYPEVRKHMYISHYPCLLNKECSDKI